MVEGVFNRSNNQSVSLLGRAEIVIKRQMFKKEKKCLTTAWSFSICGHESRRFVSLVEAMSEQICVFSCGHESRRVVSLVLAMSREELCL